MYFSSCNTITDTKNNSVDNRR